MKINLQNITAIDKNSNLLLTVKVCAGAKLNKIGEIFYHGEIPILKIYTTQIPEKNKANKEIIKMIAKYFNLKISNITIEKGATSSIKIVAISN
jgi:uncharacterized protein YggU (UPF0235/DUF167 family)